MSIKLGINGFGRIGRMTLRSIINMFDFNIVIFIFDNGSN